MKKLRVAIVGFGFMGKTHALNLLQSTTMELVAIVDNRPDAVGQSGGNLDTGALSQELLMAVNQYGTLDDCLNNEVLDLIYICVHTSSHYELAMKSLQRNLHVFIEKPFVLVVEEGRRLLEEAIRRNRKIGVGHVVRFMPAYAKLTEFYRNKSYGDLKFISLNRISGVPDWGEWNKRRQDFGSSGGALFDLLIHDIDYLQYLLGIPDNVRSTTIGGALSKHDYVSAFWQYKNIDMQVKIEGGNIFPSKFPFEASFKACFEKAAVCWSSGNGPEVKVVTDDNIEIIAVEDANEGYRNEEAYFATCILDDINPENCSAASSLESVKLCYRHFS